MSSETIPSLETLKRSPLYSLQTALGAKMGPFGGWELPLYYTSILQEHQTVREKVGLFDVSHLGHLEVRHPEVVEKLQLLVTQDLRRLAVEKACYTPMLTEEGFILDEMILYRLGRDRIRLVVNAANGDRVLTWLRRWLPGEAQIEDLRQKVGTLAIQGPKAVLMLGQVSSDRFDQLDRYALRQGRVAGPGPPSAPAVAGKPAWVARTGYTGEDGFELFVATPDLKSVWEGLLQAGQSYGIAPIGLGARDTLRLEAGLPLGGSDLDETTTPLEAGLDWTVSWEKGPFIGRQTLEEQKRSGVRRRLAGFELKETGIPRHGYPIFQKNRRIGTVTSGTLLSHSRRGIGLGFVEPSAASPGGEIHIEIHGRRVAACVVKLPFYRRKA